MQIRKHNIIILITIAFCVTTNAQNFSVKGRLNTVQKNGFYAIDVTPELSSYIANDFRDLRIADDKEKTVPYIVRPTQPVFSSYNYFKLPIIKNELADSGRSVLIIQNNDAKKIAAIALILRNAAVARTATISGSDDANHWFTVDEDIYFQKQFVTDADKYVQTVQFPTSTYRYLKIVIDNGKNNPLNIIEAGIYTSDASSTALSYITNPAASFSQVDSADKNTYLHIKQPAAYHFTRIRLLIKGPHFYQRSIDILTGANTSSNELVSGKKTVFSVQPSNDSTFLIKIYNGDNPALQVDSVLTEQESKQVVTYLEAGKTYHLLMHDPLAIKPVYDLKQFKDSISYDIPTLQVVSVEKINSVQPADNSFISKNWIWPVIIIVLIVLGFFTLRLTREVGKRDV